MIVMDNEFSKCVFIVNGLSRQGSLTLNLVCIGSTNEITVKVGYAKTLVKEHCKSRESQWFWVYFMIDRISLYG